MDVQTCEVSMSRTQPAELRQYSSVGRASHLECVRRGFESHLSALEKVVSGLVLCCVVLLCITLSFFLSFSLSKCPSIHVYVDRPLHIHST